MEGGYVALDATTYVTGGSKKVSAILPADYKPVLIQHPATGRIIKVATQQAVAAAAGRKTAARSSGAIARPAKPKGPDDDEQLLDRLVDLMHLKSPEKFGRAWLRALADQVFQTCHVRGDHLRAVAKAFGWPAGAVSTSWYGGRLPKALVDKLDDRRLVLLMFDLVFLDRGYDRGKILALFGIKESAERDWVIAERKKAAALARAARTAKASAAPKKAVKPAAKGKKK